MAKKKSKKGFVNDDSLHVLILKFENAIKDRYVSPPMRDEFSRFIKNRCSPGGLNHEKGTALLEQYTAAQEQVVQEEIAQQEEAERIRQANLQEQMALRKEAVRRGEALPGSRPGHPSVLGEAFHNPYTFIPFPNEAPIRREPTPLTIDELKGEQDRFTGVVDLELETLSPLLSCSPRPVDETSSHKTYRALTNGKDVIVPATAIRGALRTLLTIITGGTLGYIDNEVWLCQGRDAKMGPAGKNSPDAPKTCFLAKVLSPGDYEQQGTVALGKTKLVKADDLERTLQSSIGGRLDDWRPQSGKRLAHLWCDGGLTSIKKNRDTKHPWQIKLSGRPVNRKGKREGLFLDSGIEIKLPGMLWGAFGGRNRHGDHPELKAGELVWLEPQKTTCMSIGSAEDIKSIQWARWGREGERLLDIVWHRHKHLLPDAFNPDGKVDEVTDLFGQVPRKDLGIEIPADRQEPGPAGPFAARIRPENLVFHDVVEEGVERAVPLAPLAPPHPGCAAFYRDYQTIQLIQNKKLPLRGYKVYRTTSEQGDKAPWLFNTQGVYDPSGRLKDAKQKVNKTCDLLRTGQSGHLRISCRALSKRELALLLVACCVDWRLGGGKPLGLGACRIKKINVINEAGKEEVGVITRDSESPAILPDELSKELREQDQPRLLAWQASQRPVDRLRYPRAVDENHNKKNRGGHVWFSRHATPRKVGTGLEVLWTDGELKAMARGDKIDPQALPYFSSENPGYGDLLFGHDLFKGDNGEFYTKARDRRLLIKKLEPFDEVNHARKDEKSGGKQGQSRKTRADERKGRRDSS